MKIVDLQTTVVGTPWRELTFLELETDSGLVGLGEVRMVNKTDTLLACIRELAPRYVVDTDPFDIERLAWNRHCCIGGDCVPQPDCQHENPPSPSPLPQSALAGFRFRPK
jgi:L-alanine-DL-glutamate epimerase-like enolase superfamily enzyme